ncbi:MAG: hypothetical protein LBC85_03030 [Fibromonadaceae bacterium]|nr:hypothetical protein [Fibromonadaceae bacterium]
MFEEDFEEEDESAFCGRCGSFSDDPRDISCISNHGFCQRCLWSDNGSECDDSDSDNFFNDAEGIFSERRAIEGPLWW